MSEPLIKKAMDILDELNADSDAMILYERMIKACAEKLIQASENGSYLPFPVSC
ncbi:hypothetical protein M1N64_00695 [Peptococcaceae bacterium]|nr:hypothetical protein [Peptococcaceae bacterium]